MRRRSLQAEVERDLLVAGAARVQAPPGVANPFNQAPLDEAAHLRPGRQPIRAATAFVEDFFSAAMIVRTSGLEHSGRLERLGPRDAAGHVVFEQQSIEAERNAEIEGGDEGAVSKRPDQSVISDSPGRVSRCSCSVIGATAAARA